MAAAPGKPVQNAFAESFIDRLRNELATPPNPANIFRNIAPAVLAAARINACDAIPAQHAPT
jgi:hypothetical protein